jgi:hypothetical protein
MLVILPDKGRIKISLYTYSENIKFVSEKRLKRLPELWLMAILGFYVMPKVKWTVTYKENSNANTHGLTTANPETLLRCMVVV